MTELDEFVVWLYDIFINDPLQTLLVTATFLTTMIIAKTLAIHNSQARTKNFEVIMNYIGNDTARDCRARIHNNEEIMTELKNSFDVVSERKLKKYDIKYVFECFDKEDLNGEDSLRLWLEIVRYVSAMYDRVGTLLIDDKTLKRKFIQNFFGLNNNYCLHSVSQNSAHLVIQNFFKAK